MEQVHYGMKTNQGGMTGLDKVCSRDYLHKQRLVAAHIAAGSSSSSMDPFARFLEESAWVFRK